MAVLLKDEEEPEDFGTIVSFKSLEIIEMGKVIVERAFRIISELRGDGVCTAFNEWLVKYLKNIYSGQVLNFSQKSFNLHAHFILQILKLISSCGESDTSNGKILETRSVICLKLKVDKVQTNAKLINDSGKNYQRSNGASM